jgi:tetratricopeptide (TPR) repeat protein
LLLRTVAALLVASVAVAACTTSPTTPNGTYIVGDFKIDTSRGNADSETFGKYLSARFAAEEHDLTDAARYYRESLKRDPNNQDLLLLAFFYSTSAGDVDEAARLAEQVTKTATDDRAARLALAVAAMKHHDFTDARKQLAQSAKGPFTTLTSGLLDAWAAAGQGDAPAAIADAKGLSSQVGADALVAFHLALLDEYLGRVQEADAAYRDALLKAEASPRIVDAYGRFLERNGRKAEAAAFYNKLATDAPLSPIVSVGAARVASGKKPDPLIATAQEGAAEALFGIASSLTDESSADVSILYLRLALYLRPDLDLADVLLGDRLETLQKYQDAIGVYRSVQTDSPYWRLAEVQIAIDDGRLGKNDEAITELKKIVAQSPGDVEAQTALGDAYRNVEQWDEAIVAYDAAEKGLTPLQSKDWPLLYARAVAEERGKHWERSEQDLQAALKLSPDEPQVLNYLGYSWVDQGRNIPRALDMLEKARNLRPYDGYIVDSVGWAYFKLGRYGDAAKTLENAILLVPGDPTINDHLGDAYWRVGKKIDARFQWSHALAFDPDPGEKVAIEKKLKDGLGASDKPT